MPPPVYTELLWETSSFDLVNPSPVVPDGFRWVITDMRCTLSGTTPGAIVLNFHVFDPLFVPLWEMGAPNCIEAYSYEWIGRQVLDAGDYLTYASSASEVDLRVTGFVLSLP